MPQLSPANGRFDSPAGPKLTQIFDGYFVSIAGRLYQIWRRLTTHTRAVKTYVYIALWMSWPTDNSVNACVTGAMATLLLYEWDDVCLQIYTYLYVVVRGTPMRCEHSIATLGIAVQLNQQHIKTEIVIFAPEKISMFISMMMMTSVVM